MLMWFVLPTAEDSMVVDKNVTPTNRVDMELVKNQTEGEVKRTYIFNNGRVKKAYTVEEKNGGNNSQLNK